MRWICAIPILLWISTALADVGHCKHARYEADTDPCWTSSDTGSKSVRVSWSAQISRHTAVYVIRHVRNACRVIEGIAVSQSEQLAPEFTSILNNLRDEVLTPIYRSHPSLARGSLPNDSRPNGVHPDARTTRKDIGRTTAVRLERALTKNQQELFRAGSKSVNQSGSKDSAKLALDPFVDAAAELNFASKVVFEAYSDLWAKQLRSVPGQPRTPDSDANFRKSAPPLGSVKLSAAVLTSVKAFMHQVRRDLPDDDWIASILWAADRRSKGPNDIDWINSGAGLTLGSFRRTEVPPDIIDKVGGVDIMFSAPDPSILKGKTIDLEKGQFILGN